MPIDMTDPRSLSDTPPAIRGLIAVALAAIAVVLGGTVAAFVAPPESEASLPLTDRVRDSLAGPESASTSVVERLLSTSNGPFNGHGTMRPAFTTKSVGWSELTNAAPAEALRTLSEEREGECLAVLAWLRAGADPAAFTADDFPLPGDLAGQPLTAAWRGANGAVRIRSLWDTRCADCHRTGGRNDRASAIPLDTYDRLRPYAVAKRPAATVRAEMPAVAAGAGFGLIVCLTATGFLTFVKRGPRAIRLTLASGPLVAMLLTAVAADVVAGTGRGASFVVIGAGATAAGLGAQVLVCLTELARPARPRHE